MADEGWPEIPFAVIEQAALGRIKNRKAPPAPAVSERRRDFGTYLAT
jgi:hypothetical protein